MPTDPEIQYRLHKEVTEVFGDSGDCHISLEQLDNIEQLPILEAVFVETQRYARVAAAVVRVRKQPFLLSLRAPALITLPRIVLDDEVILGHWVPKGSMITWVDDVANQTCLRHRATDTHGAFWNVRV